eukprot:gene18166-24598_t
MKFFKHPHLLNFSDAAIHKCALCCLCGKATGKKAMFLSSAWVLVGKPDEGGDLYAGTRDLGPDALHGDFVAAIDEYGPQAVEANMGIKLPVYAHAGSVRLFHGKCMAREAKTTAPTSPPPSTSPSTSWAALDGTDPLNVDPLGFVLEPMRFTRGATKLLEVNEQLVARVADMEESGRSAIARVESEQAARQLGQSLAPIPPPCSMSVPYAKAWHTLSQAKAKPSQAKLQAYERALRDSRYFSTCGQDKADNKLKLRSFQKAARIPKEKRAAEPEAIQKELVADLGMAQDVASKVLKKAATHKSTSVMSLENCRGWITTLRQLGLDDKGVIQGLTGSPKILGYSAGGREEANIEVLRVLQQAGLESALVMHVLQKNPAVLSFLPAALAQRLDRLANMGFPPGSNEGPLLKNPLIINASLQFSNVEWLTAKGFPEPQIRRMILSRPTMLMYSLEECLGPMLDYVTWVLGSKETAVELLTKQPKMFGAHPTSIHAKLLMLNELVGCSPSFMLQLPWYPFMLQLPWYPFMLQLPWYPFMLQLPWYPFMLQLPWYPFMLQLPWYPFMLQLPWYPTMSSLLSRPFDLVVFIYFATHIPITLLIDSQSIIPSDFYPSWAQDALEWHIKVNGDHLVSSNFPWFQALAACELLFQFPFFFVAAYAFACEKRWIRIPALIYGVHVATTMIPILGDFMMSFSPPKWQLAAIYSPYFFIPLMLAIRMAAMENPFPCSSSKKKKAKGA